jgi:hypothetical protein
MGCRCGLGGQQVLTADEQAARSRVESGQKHSHSRRDVTLAKPRVFPRDSRRLQIGGVYGNRSDSSNLVPTLSQARNEKQEKR